MHSFVKQLNYTCSMFIIQNSSNAHCAEIEIKSWMELDKVNAFIMYNIECTVRCSESSDDVKQQNSFGCNCHRIMDIIKRPTTPLTLNKRCRTTASFLEMLKQSGVYVEQRLRQRPQGRLKVALLHPLLQHAVHDLTLPLPLVVGEQVVELTHFQAEPSTQTLPVATYELRQGDDVVDGHVTPTLYKRHA